jgi:hypothetical protein
VHLSILQRVSPNQQPAEKEAKKQAQEKREADAQIALEKYEANLPPITDWDTPAPVEPAEPAPRVNRKVSKQIEVVAEATGVPIANKNADRRREIIEEYDVSTDPAEQARLRAELTNLTIGNGNLREHDMQALAWLDKMHKKIGKLPSATNADEFDLLVSKQGTERAVIGGLLPEPIVPNTNLPYRHPLLHSTENPYLLEATENMRFGNGHKDETIEEMRARWERWNEIHRLRAHNRFKKDGTLFDAEADDVDPVKRMEKTKEWLHRNLHDTSFDFDKEEDEAIIQDLAAALSPSVTFTVILSIHF